MSDVSLRELFRVEAENQTAIIHRGLLELERDGASPALLESLMRAAHSLKGAARIVKLPAAVTLAHAMEDCFAAARKGLRLEREHFDLLLQGADQIVRISAADEDQQGAWPESHGQELGELTAAIRACSRGPEAAAAIPPPPAEREKAPPEPAEDKPMRIDAGRLDRLMALASELLVESRRLPAFGKELLMLKQRHDRLLRRLEDIHQRLQAEGTEDGTLALLREIHRQAAASRDGLTSHCQQFDGFERRSARLARQLYREAGAGRMAPFGDCTAGFPRMVRDLAWELGKEVRLEMAGADTPVDRDILERLQAPLAHLLRNAVDHGLESPAERRAAGKPPEGLIRLEARHHGGRLSITVSDDGRGIDLQAVREAAVRRGLVPPDLAGGLSEGELLEFLYLPNFTLRQAVTEVSGRGVGLDVVLNTLRQLHSSAKTSTEPGQGSRFQLQLPLSLSLIRGLVVQISGEPYVFPLARVDRVLALTAGDLQYREDREHFLLDGEPVGLVDACRLLDLPPRRSGGGFGVVVLEERRLGLVVDRSPAETSVAVQPLDPRLGKVRDVMAGTVLEDGTPALILDVDDVLRSLDRLLAGGGRGRLEQAAAPAERPPKRVLVVDDSFTVREMGRKLLEQRGYRVDLAVDGMDGWNAVRGGGYDLVVTDLDMPGLNGIELVELIRKDPALQRLPVMIVSYKEREEDRHRGLKAGADHYLAKGGFHDESLLAAVSSLIGEA